MTDAVLLRCLFQGASAAGAPLAAGTPRTSGSNVGDHASTGFTGGGATAFPAQESGKDLHGEHLADFEKVTAASGSCHLQCPCSGCSDGFCGTSVMRVNHADLNITSACILVCRNASARTDAVLAS